MATFDKCLVGVIALGVFLLICGCFAGAFWSDTLRADCRIAAMNTHLYDSAHIAQICGK